MRIAKKNQQLILLFFCLFCVFLITKTTLAADLPQMAIPSPEIKIPGVVSETLFKAVKCTEGTECAIPWIGEYLKAMYIYGLGIIGILATVVMMIGGLQWMMSGGDSGKVTNARKMIESSIIGIVVALTSYMILFQINPDLTTIKPIKLMAIKEIPIEAGNEASEAVITGQTKGMECFYEKYGQNEEMVQAHLTTARFMGLTMQLSPKVKDALENAEKEIKSKYNGNYKFVSGGSFNWRPNANNPNQQSLHSFGVAFDLNPGTNPNYKKNGSTAACQSDIPQEVITALKNNGFRWGGDFSTVCDAMHFEWIEGCKK